MLFDPQVADKLVTKHHVTPDEVRQAVLFSSYRDARWHDHPVYGRRLIVRGHTDDQVPMLVILKPVDEEDGIWECRTASEEPLMGYPDENDLSDIAIKAMWDEGEPVELAGRSPRPMVEIAPSPWTQLGPYTAARGQVTRRVVYLSYFGAATGRYAVRPADAGKIQTASEPA